MRAAADPPRGPCRAGTSPAAADPLRASRRAGTLAAALAAVGVVVTGGVLAAAVSALSVRPAPSHVIGLAGLRLALPDANAPAIALLSLAALGASVVLAGARGAGTLALRQWRLRRALPIVGRLERQVWIVSDPRPHAFCLGLLRPAVYVSSGTLERLAPRELAAVLAHEHLHRRRRDPLRVATGRVLAEALFFLPVLRRLTERYVTLAELAADAHAVATCGDGAALASAMIAFGDGGILPERVDQLSGRPLDWRLPVTITAASIAGVGALGLLIWQLARHAILSSTLGVPLLSSQPCVVMLALMPCASVALGLWATRRL